MSPELHFGITLAAALLLALVASAADPVFGIVLFVIAGLLAASRAS